MDDLLGETVAEIGLRIGAEIRERENHYRWFSETGRGWAQGFDLKGSFPKDRGIASLREIDDERIGGAFGQVIFPKFRPHPGSVYPDDSSDSRIKFAVRGIKLDPNEHLFEVLVRRG
jgi:hypothetical protein